MRTPARFRSEKELTEADAQQAKVETETFLELWLMDTLYYKILYLHDLAKQIESIGITKANIEKSRKNIESMKSIIKRTTEMGKDATNLENQLSDLEKEHSLMKNQYKPRNKVEKETLETKNE